MTRDTRSTIAIMAAVALYDGAVTIHERIDSPTAPEAVGYNGVYTSLRDRVRIDNLNATWSFDGTALRLSDMTGGSCGDAVIWTTHPWVRRSESVPQTAVPQTAVALQDGTYDTVLTLADRRLCADQPGGGNLNPPNHPETWYLSFVLDHGTIREYERYGSRSGPPTEGWAGTSRALRDVLELTETPGGAFSARFTFDGTTLALTPLGRWQCDDRIVWSLHPWTLTKRAS